MKKKVISIVLIILLVLGFVGCGEKESKEDKSTETTQIVNNNTETVVFDNNFMSFTHLKEYVALNIQGAPDTERTFMPTRTPSLFKFQLSEKSGDTLETRTWFYEKEYNKPEEDCGFDKTEDITVDGKSAKYITFDSPDLRTSFLVIDYSKDHFIIFQFYLKKV